MIDVTMLIEDIINGPTKFLGDCFRIRLKPNGEEWWQYMMSNKEPITMDEFLDNVDPSSMLDEDETFYDYIQDNPQFDEFYKVGSIFFMADGDPNGFEYFWDISND